MSTASVVLVVTGGITNFFSPAEIDLAKARFWTLPVGSRLLLLGASVGIPILLVQGARFALHTLKQVVGWDSLPRRSAWFFVSRLVGLVAMFASAWWLGQELLHLYAALAS